MQLSLLNSPAGFEFVTRLTGWRIEDNGLIATAETSAGNAVKISLRAESPEIWRIQFSPDGSADARTRHISDADTPIVLRARASALPQLPLVINSVGPAVRLDVQESDAGLILRGAALTLEILREPWCLTFRDANGRVICRENPYDVDGLNRLFIRPLGFTRAADGTVVQVTESFHLNADEHLLGLGEKFTPLDKTRQRIVSWTVDALGAASERAYKNVPLLISSRGYGVFLNTGRRITYELGTESCETYTLVLDAPYLDAYLIFASTPAEILERYTRLTGRAPVPPKWSFGLWLSGGGRYRDENAIRRLVAGIGEHDLPCDVIHIDTWWMRLRQYADFQWDPAAFPHPEELIDELHAQNLKLSAWQHPYISVESDLFAEGAKRNYFARRPNGEVYVIDYGLSLSSLPAGVVHVAAPDASWNARVAIIDLTEPDAVEWYKGLMRPVLAMGLDTFKTDFGEDIPADAVFANGMTGAEMHNLYPLLYNRAVFEVTQQVKGEGIVWGRSAYAGSQRYPTYWSGDPACDWDSLACTIRGGLSFGLSGVPFWSNDIGGYRGTPSEQLYIRWAQFGLLCSHARCHGETPREPWYYGERALEIFRRYVRLRYELFPYLYSCAHEAARTGLPVLRAMPLAFPYDAPARLNSDTDAGRVLRASASDLNTFDKDLQFMLGPWLLVAPIYDEGEERRVYLPEGQWLDYWTGEILNGPKNLTVHAPIDRLPLFVRGGAILPRMLPASRTPSGLVDPLIFELYPYGNSQYRMYEDESITDVSCAQAEQSVTCEWMGGADRSLWLRFVRAGMPRRVELGKPGEELTLHTDWQVQEDGTLVVRVSERMSGMVKADL